MRQVKDLLKSKGHQIWSISPESSVFDALKLMSDKDVGALLVLKADELVGIFSERDLVTRVVAQGIDPASTKVGDVMTKEVAVLGEDHTYKDALAIMKQIHVRHLPVLVGKQIIGCVSIRDLREAEVETQEAEIDFLDNYIETMEEVAWGGPN